MMAEKGQVDTAVEYGLLPFEVSILAPTRTLCEKIMSLVRFSYTKKPITDLRNKIRHVYDLHQLLGQDNIAVFFNSLGFDEMLHKVAQDDELSFRNNKDWLYNHPCEALIFSDIDMVWSELIVTYNGPFKTLVFGELPDSVFIKKTLLMISERLSSVEWRMLKNAE